MKTPTLLGFSCLLLLLSIVPSTVARAQGGLLNWPMSLGLELKRDWEDSKNKMDQRQKEQERQERERQERLPTTITTPRKQDGFQLLMASGTEIPATKALMDQQSNKLVPLSAGNLVFYGADESVKWQSNSQAPRREQGARLAMQADGNLVFYTTDSFWEPICWSTNTNSSQNRGAYLEVNFAKFQLRVMDAKGEKILWKNY